MPSAAVVDTYSVNGGPPIPGKLRIEQQIEWIRSDRATKPDPTWAHFDAQGHFHAFDEDGELPTLIATSVPVPCDGSCGGVCGGEGYHVTRYNCRACDQKIKPRWVPDMEAQTIGTPVPMLKEWTLELQGGQEVMDLPDGQVSVRGADAFGFGWVVSRHITRDPWSGVTVEATITGTGPWAKRL